ncbi:hypothetical protein H0H93_007470 [Arthromyces matolae]|nr:hypothetical protein H0H93_007470 [Arthromyces matolae]
MSAHIDLPLLSPIQDWDSTSDSYPQYYIPPTSPSPMLKLRMSPDSQLDQQELCIPPAQLFDSQDPPQKLSISINPSVVANSKRSASSPTEIQPKKPRAAVERINSKDFIPPDVSGLSKREARLVKNRAAAFLSRQRKREEFELMEVRVNELEQENARLMALTQNDPNSVTVTPSATCDQELLSIVEDLKAQLASSKERERQLIAELANSKAPSIKVEESADPQLSQPLSSARSSATSPHKSGASLGLMVLLCALPTLLSMPMKSALPKRFALPDASSFPSAPATFDFNSIISNDYDWSRNIGTNMMDLDDLDILSPSPAAPQKLEFATETDTALNGLDISFDTVPADNGKIRVRIHPSSGVSTVPSRAVSPGISDAPSSAPSPSSPTEILDPIEAAISSVSAPSPSSFLAPPSSPGGDPFLGIGPPPMDYSMPYSSEIEEMFGPIVADDALSDTSGLGSEWSSTTSETTAAAAKRRVRIALKSMPAAGGEGGEWEVQIC